MDAIVRGNYESGAYEENGQNMAFDAQSFQLTSDVTSLLQIDSNQIYDAHFPMIFQNHVNIGPKPVGFVIGEKVVRPAIDFLSASGVKISNVCSSFFRSLNQYASLLPNFLPLASAEELSIDAVGAPDSHEKKKSTLAYEKTVTGSQEKDHGFYGEALKHFEEAKNLYLESEGPFSSNSACAIENMGHTYGSRGDHLLAIQSFRKALEIYQVCYEEVDSNTARIFSSIAVQQCELGEYTNCHENLKKAQEIYSQTEGPRSIEVGNTIQEIGKMFIKQKNYLAGIDKLKESLEILKENSTEPNPDNANIHNLIGSYWVVLEENNEAIIEFRKAKEIYLLTEGPESIEVATTAYYVGTTLVRLGKREEAIEEFKEAKTIYSQVLGSKAIKTARVTQFIGIGYAEENNNSNALPYLREALEIFNSSDLEIDLDVADYHEHSAHYLTNMNQYDDAIVYLQMAERINSEIKGPTSPEVAKIKEKIAVLELLRLTS